MEIWFARHGQTEWNVQKRFQGHANSPLTPLGRAQAVNQGAILRRSIGDLSRVDILVSPLGRVIETVELALPNHPYQVVDDLRELGLGSLTGASFAKRAVYDPRFAASDPDAIAAAYFDIHDGEDQKDFELRLERAICGRSRPAVVFSHGFVGQVIRKRMLGVPRFTDLSGCDDQGVIFHIKNGIETVLRGK